jgi:hypothetical protein
LIFLAAVSVNVMVKAIPLLLLSWPAVASPNELSPTPHHVHGQPITPSALSGPHTFPLQTPTLERLHTPIQCNRFSTLRASRRTTARFPSAAFSSDLDTTHALPAETETTPYLSASPITGSRLPTIATTSDRNRPSTNLGRACSATNDGERIFKR